MNELVYVYGECEQVISSEPNKPDEDDTGALDVFAAPYVAIAEEQAALLWHILQSKPSKPDVHCPVPVQPDEDAVLSSADRCDALAIGFSQMTDEQLLPLHIWIDWAYEDKHKVESRRRRKSRQ